MEASSWRVPTHNEVLHYLMIMQAGRDFGLSDDDVIAVAGPFDPRRPRCAELADALADLILACEDRAGR